MNDGEGREKQKGRQHTTQLYGHELECNRINKVKTQDDIAKI